MEIIFRGTPPEDKLIDATCQHCKSIIRFRRAEANVTHDQREGWMATVTCPVCSTLIYKSL